MKDKKGFMLAEIIIVSVVVMGVLVSLFTLINYMFVQYDKRIVYDEVDATYVAKGLAENYTKNIMMEFEENSQIYKRYDKNYGYLKKNNVVHAYIVKYEENYIKTFLDDAYYDKDNKLSDDDQIGINFYDYILRYINSNDFSDSFYVNNNENDDTFNYIIFTAISDNCDENNVCVEDNGNISFGNCKFRYVLNNEEEGLIKDEYPPFVHDFNIDDAGLITFGSVDNNDIKELVVSVKDVAKNTEKSKTFNFDDIYNDARKRIEINKTELGISYGKYSIVIYGVDKLNNSGKSSCMVNDSRYCINEEFMLGKINYSVDNENSSFKMNTGDDEIYKRATISFNVGTGSEDGYKFEFKNWSVSDSDGVISSGSNTGTIKVKVRDKDFKITVSSTKKKKGCLVEGTKVLLANGKYKNIEDIDYNDLLVVYDHEYGTISYQYPGWIEKPGTASNYVKVSFSDGNTIGFVNDHAVYSFDYNQYINISDKEKFKIGSKVAKLKNNKVEVVYVKDIEVIDEEINYYHILTNKHFNIITNDIITVNKEIFVSNFHRFDVNMKWKIPSLVDVYDYNEMSEIPYYLFEGLRLYEGKYFINYGMSKESYIEFLKDFILDEEKTLSLKLNENGNRQWMVTTSDDVVTENNKLTYLMEEGSIYILKYPNLKVNKKFIGWLHTGENKIYQPGDKVEVLYGTHFIAKYENLFNDERIGDYFEKNG